MKVICINDKYGYKDPKESLFYNSYITIGKIYNVVQDSIDTSPNFKRVFMIVCDDNIIRTFPEEMVIPISKWREQQINKII